MCDALYYFTFCLTVFYNEIIYRKEDVFNRQLLKSLKYCQVTIFGGAVILNFLIHTWWEIVFV